LAQQPPRAPDLGAPRSGLVRVRSELAAGEGAEGRRPGEGNPRGERELPHCRARSGVIHRGAGPWPAAPGTCRRLTHWSIESAPARVPARRATVPAPRFLVQIAQMIGVTSLDLTQFVQFAQISLTLPTVPLRPAE